MPDNHPYKGIDQPEMAHQNKQRNNQQDDRKHIDDKKAGEKHVPSGKFEPRKSVSGRDADRQTNNHRPCRDQQTIEPVVEKTGALPQHFKMVGGEFAGPIAHGKNRQIRIGFDRRQKHPDKGRERKNKNDQNR